MRDVLMPPSDPVVPSCPGTDIAEITIAKCEVCRDILTALPEWFGRPDAIGGFVASVEPLTMFGCRAGDEVVGFVALKRHTAFALEIYLLGLKREWHGQGLGRGLVARAEAHARANGARFLTVKTLSDSCPDPWYQQTRRFYAAVGFSPIEELPTLWGPQNQCLLLAKAL